MKEADLTPAKIVAELDRYVIGQSEAKKAVAVAPSAERSPPRTRDDVPPAP